MVKGPFDLGKVRCLKTGGGRLGTSDVDALVDDELAVPQVVEDGLKVLRAAVDEEGAALVPRVAPHVCSDNSGATWWSAAFP